MPRTSLEEQDAQIQETIWRREAEERHPRPWRAKPDGLDFAWILDKNGVEVATILVKAGADIDAPSLATALVEAVNAAEGEVVSV